jgi:1-acyl-sn-glycerol-3-phosphate acyltransferase
MSYDRFTSRFQAGARFVAQRGMLKPLVWRLVTVRVHGSEHASNLHGSFVLIANHSSHLDAPLLFGALPRRSARYLAAGAAADYFFEVPWRKWLTTLFFNAFAVERNAEGKRASESRRLLDEGVPILLFPEGGRARAGEFRPYKPGPFAVAIAADRPVLPVALVGASAAMPRGVSWPLRGRMPVDVVIGEPMTALPDEKPRDFSDRVAARVRELHESVAPVPPNLTSGRMQS